MMVVVVVAFQMKQNKLCGLDDYTWKIEGT
jgi:hypothetical protein